MLVSNFFVSIMKHFFLVMLCVLVKAETGGKGCILNARMRPDQVLGPSDVSEAYTTRL